MVRADPEAVKSVEFGGAKIENSVRLTDLSQGGWSVGLWERADDGSASISIRHRFSSVDQIPRLFEQISGADGPLRDMRASRDSGFFATDYSVGGSANLRDVKTGVPADPELVASLTGQQVDPNVIDQQLLAQLQASFGLKFVVKLPGKDAQTFPAKPGAVVPIDASSSVQNRDRILFLVAAAGFASLGIFVALLGRRSRRRRRRGRGRRTPARQPAATRAAPSRPPPPPPPPPPPLRRRPGLDPRAP